MAVTIHWTGILDWTTGLSYFPFLDKYLYLFLVRKWYDSNALIEVQGVLITKTSLLVLRHFLANHTRCQHNYYRPVQVLINHQRL